MGTYRRKVEIPANTPGVGYSLKHRKAVKMLLDYYCKQAVGKRDGNGELFTPEDYRIMHNRGICHDMDKVLCGLSYPQLTADYIHRMMNGHHIEGFIEPQNKSKYDWIEMLIDWESSGYTKPDKTMNAYMFLHTRCEELRGYIEPYLMLLDINNATHSKIEYIVKEAQKPVYETDLVDAMTEYIHTTHIHMMDWVSRIDDRGYKEVFKQPVPCRHKATEKESGTVYNRPNAYTRAHPHSLNLEMVNGTVEAQIFDMDRVCQLKADEVKSLNKLCAERDKVLREKKKAR